MEFMSVRDFRNSPKEVWRKLERDGKLVITNNGKPTAVMLEIDDRDFEYTLDLLRQTEAMRAANELRVQSMRNGNTGMGMDEIEAEIAAARREIED